MNKLFTLLLIYIFCYFPALAINNVNIPAPTAYAGTSISHNSFTASWSFVLGVSHYEIDLSTNPNFFSYVVVAQEEYGTATFFTNLSPNTTYYYRVRAVGQSQSGGGGDIFLPPIGGGGDIVYEWSPNSNTIAVTTSGLPPTANGASNRTSTSFQANWSAVSGASSYRLDVSSASNFSSFIPGYNNRTVNSLNDVITGLSPNTTYYYRVRSVMSSGSVSINSNVITTSTLQMPPPVVNNASNISASGFTASWNPVTGANGYVIDVSTNSWFEPFLPPYNNYSTFGQGSSFGITTNNGNQAYYYRMRATFPGGQTGHSSWVKVLHTADWITTAPPAEHNLGTNVVVGLRAKNGSSPRFQLYKGTQPITSPSTSGSISTDNLQPGTDYRVRVFDNENTSLQQFTGFFQIRLLAPAAPNSITNISTTGFTASWAATVGATGYEVQVLLGGTVVRNVSLTGTSTSFTGLLPATQYTVRVRATRTGGITSNFSPSTNVTTRPNPPVAILANNITPTSFTARWNPVTGATGYVIDVSTNEFFTLGSFIRENTNVSSQSSSFSIPITNANQAYFYRLRAVTSGGQSVHSNVIKVVYTADWINSPTSGSFPIGSNITINAKAKTPTQTQYELYKGSTRVWGPSATNVVPTLSLASGNDYRIRVFDSGFSHIEQYSGNLTIFLTAPNAPSFSSTTSSSFTASWGSSAAANSYQIDVSTASNFATGTFVSGFQNRAVSGTSINVTGLQPNTLYYVRIRAVRGSVVSSSSSTASWRTLLATPQLNSPTSITASSFSLNWGSISGAAEYELEIATDAGFNNKLGTYAPRVVSGTSHAVTGLNPATRYYARLRAKNSNNLSEFSNGVNTFTMTSNPVANAATGVTNTSFIANWSGVTNAQSYRLDVATDAGFNNKLSAYNDIQANSGIRVENLVSGTTYHYRVRAINQSGLPSGSSNVISAQPFLLAPGNISVGTPTSNDISISWSSVIHASRYKVEISLNSNFAPLLPAYQNTLTTNTNFTFTQLNPNTVYHIRVRSENDNIVSAYTNFGSFRTKATAPSGLSASQISPNGFSLSWLPVGGISSYVVDVATNSSFSSPVSGFSNHLVQNSNTVSVADLQPGEQYFSRVRSRNATGDSEPSETLALYTKLLSPSQLQSSAITLTSFTLSWPAVNKATSYNVIVSSSPGFESNSTYYNQNTISTTTANYSGMPAGSKVYVKIKALNLNTDSEFSETYTFSLSPLPNYVKTFTYLEPGLSSIPDKQIPNDPSKVALVTEYFDGFGRPFQTVAHAQSPTQKDIVSAIEYDAFGRNYKNYLPYAVDGGGLYRENAIKVNGVSYQGSEQYQFYQSTPKVATDTKPYAETLFEASPRNRSIAQSAPGEAWSLQGGKTVKNRFRFNQTEEVYLWKYDPASRLVYAASTLSGTSPQYYEANTLYVSEVEDENGQISLQLQDKRGRTLVKKHKLDANTWAETHYIYDVFDNLVCEIQPEGMKNIEDYLNANESGKEKFLNNWAFRYKYDGRRRLIEKQVPGGAMLYIVYDRRDRVVLTQDGNQRNDNKWSFIKYDAFNRPILTGMYEHNVSMSQTQMDALISTTDFFDTYNGNSSFHGYTNNVFPTTNADNSSLNIYTVTYYDNYKFRDDFAGSDYNYVDGDLSGQGDVALNRVVGLVTGTKTNVLGTSDFLWAVNYYDERYRTIQVINQNHKGGFDRVTNKVDFVGKVIESKAIHNNGTTNYSVSKRYEYDQTGRLLKTYHKLNNEPEIILHATEYNELGQTVSKKLHAKSSNTYKQQVDYRYNIRGWITRINNADLINTDGGPKDYFGMEFGYYNDLGIGDFVPQYNGNISTIKWSTNLGLALPILNEPTQRAYKYTYDPLGRLMRANHALKTGIWHETTANQESITYDLNGNIETLLRSNNKSVLVDWLVYDYGNGLDKSNRLLSVTDNGIENEGFRDANTSGNDYGYDANGNVTADKNKKLESIKYNPFLNLTEEIVKDSGEKVRYIYDAEGIKLVEEIYKAGEGTPEKRIEYVGPFVYENDILKFILHDEGKIIMPSTQYEKPEYQYQMKDHLGNVRLTFTEKETTEVFQATMEDTGIADYSNPRVQEMAYFENLFETQIRNVNQWLNHTSNSIGNAIYLDGSENRTIGPYTMLKVYPGDTVKMEVYGKFENKSSHSSMSIVDLLVALTIPLQTAAIGYEGGSVLSSLSFFEGLIPFFGNRGSSDIPAAYLNYILFDKDFIVVDMGFDRIDESAGFDVAAENTVAFDRMHLERIIDRVGYIYIYVSNESEGTRVWMDDLTITYGHSPVVHFEDYYPFGLSISGTAFERGNDDYKGMVTTDGTGLKDLGFRQYDAALGRFHAVDPLAELQSEQSTYQYAGNNPVSQVDVLGLEAEEHDIVNAKNRPRIPKRKKVKEKKYVNGEKVKVYNGFVHKPQKPRGSNSRSARRNNNNKEKPESTASNKKKSNTEKDKDQSVQSREGVKPDSFKEIRVGEASPTLYKEQTFPGILSGNNNQSQPRFENSVTPPSAFDEPDNRGTSLLAHAANRGDNVSNVEKYRQYLYSHLPSNEARALYQRMLVGRNNNYQTSRLKENLASISNSLSNDDMVGQEEKLLTREQLQTDSRFMPLTTARLRQKAQQACPSCAEYQRNIVAGNALEYAWSYWSGKPRNTNKEFKNDVRAKRVRPDFVYAKGEKGINNEGKPDLWVYPYGVFVEVKASQNLIDKTAFNKQIWGELNALSKQKNSISYTYFKDLFQGKKAEDGVLSFYLVVTEGTEITQSLIDEATSLGITFFVSYAYENIGTGGIVFSVPERKNFLNIEGIHMQIGIEQQQDGVQLDWDRAIPSWTWSNEYDESQP